MPSMPSTILLGTALLGSLLQHAAAAPEANSKRADVQFPECISTCMRNSGCFDAECICKKAEDGILSDIVICMNQWCPADVTAKDLIEPLEGQCDFSKSAVQDAEKKGGVAVDVDAGDDEDDASSKPTTTSSSGKSGDDEVIVTFDLGKPQTNPAGPATTTVTPVASGTLTVATAAATTGLLTDDSDSVVTGKLGAATSTPATSTPTTPSSSAAAGDSDKSSDDEGNAAGLTRQASVFGAVAAMGFALALGF